MAFSPETAFTYLKRAHEGGRLSHAYLFEGEDREPLEELAARTLAMGQHMEGGEGSYPSLEEIERRAAVRIVRPESKSRRISVDSIRALEHDTRLKQAGWPLKAGVILGADRMGPQAENAFLKTLEEPPPDSLLLLLTTRPDQLLPTTLSRCIRVPVFALSPRPPEAAQRKLLALLAAHFQSRSGSPDRMDTGAALRLQKEFSALLEIEKAQAVAEQKEIFDEEKDRFKDSAGAEWLGKKEIEHDAAASADYLRRREELLKLLTAWFGDALRIRAGGEALDCAAHADAVRAYAEKTRYSELIRRHHAAEHLFSLLATNVSEALALETSFAEAFG